VRMASDVPAQVLGLRKGRLAAGYDADVVVLAEDYQPWLTVIGGHVVHSEDAHNSLADDEQEEEASADDGHAPGVEIGDE
jgi:adenine deaminase